MHRLDQTTLEVILTHLLDPVVCVDCHKNIIAFNAPAARLFPSLKQGSSLLFSLRDPLIFDAIDAVIEHNTPRQEDYTPRLDRGHAYVLQIAPLILQETLCGVWMTFKDVSEARKLTQMRIDFIANASHELRTPLTALLGFLDTLEGAAKSDPQAQTQFLSLMRKEGDRMHRLMNDLLSLSSLESKANLAPTARLDLLQTVQTAYTTIKPLAHKQGVTLTLDLASNLPAPLWIQGEADEIRRVIENLLENALKYGINPQDQNPQIIVRLYFSASKSDIVLEIQDFGHGIAPEHLTRLTERFYRVDTASSRAKGGTGLGLSIVKHILNRHHTRLEISSTVGKGSLFRVVF
jgi:two-component system, OmpR family, phosphate regulon sensor histidine kinase PhoR